VFAWNRWCCIRKQETISIIFCIQAFSYQYKLKVWTNGENYFYSKTNKMHQCIKYILFSNDTTCFGQSFCPSSGAQDCTYSNRHLSNRCLLLYVQSWTPDDGWKDRLKHVVSFQNKINLIRWCILLVLL